MRHELKFMVQTQDMPYLMEWMILKQCFQVKYPDRTVSSIYFDTLQLNAAAENLSGLSKRQKHRIRWYIDGQNLYGGRYEVKYKIASLGSKVIKDCLIPPENLFPARANDVVQMVLKDKKAHEIGDFTSLVPTLLVKYSRSYYGAFGDIRLTIDKNVKFHNFLQDKESSLNASFLEYLIVEIKFPPDKQDYIAQCIADFPFRQIRTSKYVLGLSKFGYVNYI